MEAEFIAFYSTYPNMEMTAAAEGLQRQVFKDALACRGDVGSHFPGVYGNRLDDQRCMCNVRGYTSHFRQPMYDGLIVVAL